MTTPDALREKVARLIGIRHRAATDLDVADAAIRVVVEACAEVCDERAERSRTLHDNCTNPDDRADAAQRAYAAEVCAMKIRDLLPQAEKETT